jgi:valyl-tRNA synthetase
MSAFVQANILILLHPFIPFFTEKVWLDFKFNDHFKTSLMFKNWDLSKHSNFKKSYNKIDWLINLVTSIRSTKVDLNVSPGSFIEISTNELNSEKKSIINDNLSVFKRLGRVSNVSSSELNKNGVKIIVGGETVTLYLDQNLNLNDQKLKIFDKAKSVNQRIIVSNNKLKNKSFLKNAPKQIIQKEKNALIEYKIELKKLNTILNSIKN